MRPLSWSAESRRSPSPLFCFLFDFDPCLYGDDPCSSIASFSGVIARLGGGKDLEWSETSLTWPGSLWFVWVLARLWWWNLVAVRSRPSLDFVVTLGSKLQNQTSSRLCSFLPRTNLFLEGMWNTSSCLEILLSLCLFRIGMFRTPETRVEWFLLWRILKNK